MDIDVHKTGEVHVLKLRGPFRLGPAVETFRGAVDEIMRTDVPHIVRAAKDVLALPMFPELTSEEQATVVSAIAEFYS